jgi:hypothetical protein
MKIFNPNISGRSELLKASISLLAQPFNIWEGKQRYQDDVEFQGAVNQSDFGTLAPVVGSWAPELWDDSLSGSEGQTYNIQKGRYVAWGDELVFVTFQLQMAGLGSLTPGDAARIGNLPFTITSDSSTPWGTLSVGATAGTPGVDALSGAFLGGFNHITLQQWVGVGGSAAVSVSQFSATGYIQSAFGFYER